MRRVLLALAAVVLLAAGGAGVAAGAWLTATFGTDGVLRGSLGQIVPEPASLATVVDIDRFDVAVSLPDGFSETRLVVRPSSADVVFVGAAPTTEVDVYLSGSPYTVAAREGAMWVTRAVPGDRSVVLPGPVAWWLAIDQAPEAAIVVPSQRPLTVVMAHPGGVPSGPLDVGYEVVVPQARAWAVGLIIAGAVSFLLGLTCVVLVFALGRRRGRHVRRGSHAAV
jgi:hypothetical protein